MADRGNAMPSFDYDLAIIGAGSGGLTAARLGRFFAKRVVLIDKDRLGGDCLHYGCVPSKALIKASRVAHEAATAQRWGLSAQPVHNGLAAVNARVQRAIADIGKLDDTMALSELGVEVLLGGATFRDPHTLRVADRDVTAKFILITSGSRPAVPAIEGLAEVGYLTNEDVFDLSDLPGRLAVIGGGPIGVELAQAFHRLGSTVTVLQRGPHLIPRDDAEMTDILERQFAEEGIDVRLDTRLHAVHRDRADTVLPLDSGELRVDEILCAVGRVPNVESLGLDAAGGPHGNPFSDQSSRPKPRAQLHRRAQWPCSCEGSLTGRTDNFRDQLEPPVGDVVGRGPGICDQLTVVRAFRPARRNSA
ncbi:MAG: FAD-dependent oxidoreductase, partial [Actinobacteria bacterium]|nr:FAD-dependent oxidoreductase [Actinomycetota bacterium]